MELLSSYYGWWGIMNDEIYDPQLMLDRSLRDVSDFLECELRDKISGGGVPLVGMSLDGVSDDGILMRLEVRLSVKEVKE